MTNKKASTALAEPVVKTMDQLYREVAELRKKQAEQMRIDSGRSSISRRSTQSGQVKMAA